MSAIDFTLSALPDKHFRLLLLSLEMILPGPLTTAHAASEITENNESAWTETDH